jgi:hypothetical protein
MELDRVPLWRGDHVPIKVLVEDFARYLYLPRLRNPDVLLTSVMDGLGSTTWRQDSFASADSYGEGSKRFRGLLCGRTRRLADADAPGVVVKSEAALRQVEAEKTPPPVAVDGKEPAGTDTTWSPATDGEPPLPPPPPARKPKRFHGSVALDPARMTSAAGVIAESVIAHLSALVGSNVKVTLEIEAEVPSGVPDNVVRIVTENGRTLKFTTHGFEDE